MNFPSVSQFSIAKGTGGTNPPEMYIPLWWYSGGDVGQSYSTADYYVVSKGGNLDQISNALSRSKLHTLNSSWPATLQYALEVTIWTNGGSVAYAELWDFNSNAKVASSQTSTNSTTATIIRSGKFTLTPGHSYGVCVWISSNANTFYITDASLIVFPS